MASKIAQTKIFFSCAPPDFRKSCNIARADGGKIVRMVAGRNRRAPVDSITLEGAGSSFDFRDIPIDPELVLATVRANATT